jgi:hypothetical protein
MGVPESGEHDAVFTLKRSGAGRDCDMLADGRYHSMANQYRCTRLRGGLRGNVHGRIHDREILRVCEGSDCKTEYCAK